MTNQWKDELEAKFGLAFIIIDREQVADVRRNRGFSANPWAVGSRFIVSHNLVAEEAYLAGLRDLLGEFRPRALLILDEAHHAAPASSQRYAIDSQFTRSIRGLAHRFEHRLFLTATPHNGHSNSFSALLEMLDPQRFTRGVSVRPSDLNPVMVRRLKSDLRWLGEPFPERIVEPIPISGLPDDAPELVLARKLREYGDIRHRRLSRLPSREAALAKLVFSGLQQRLLSSIAAFASTLRVHRKSLANPGRAIAAAARSFAAGAAEPEESEPIDEQSAQTSLDQEETATTEAATSIGMGHTTPNELQAEIELVDEMLRLAEQHQNRLDARVIWIARWVRGNMISNGAWNNRRLILFTEWEVTRRWLERRLKEAISDLDPEPRIAVFTGLTTTDRREVIKRTFNADPLLEPLRILICTDAAREGINLQAHCHDLIHIDLPWNPARLEQRNGRIDRKLQPSPKVCCRYFVFEQREEDIVLDALVKKTDRIRTNSAPSARSSPIGSSERASVEHGSWRRRSRRKMAATGPSWLAPRWTMNKSGGAWD
jgi:SNF2 family DNA or RNA helicase